MMEKQIRKQTVRCILFVLLAVTLIFLCPHEANAEGSDDMPVKVSMNQCQITLRASVYRYNGNRKTPKVTVTYQGKKLKKNRDFTVEYLNNLNAGTGQVVVSGVESKGFTGSVTKTIKIKKAYAKIQVKENINVLVGTPDTPFGAKIISGYQPGDKKKLVYATSNRKVVHVKKNGKLDFHHAGTATIKVTAPATQNYKKTSVYVKVKVIPNSTQLTRVRAIASNSLTLEWNRGRWIDGYQVRYSTKPSMAGAGSIHIAGIDNLTHTIFGLTEGTTYYLQVRTYVREKKGNVYSLWSRRMTGVPIKRNNGY